MRRPPAPPECAPHRRESRTHLHTPICNAYYVRDRRMATGRSGRARRGSSTSAPTRNLATEEEVNFHLAPAPSSSTIISSSSFSSCAPPPPSPPLFLSLSSRIRLSASSSFLREVSPLVLAATFRRSSWRYHALDSSDPAPSRDRFVRPAAAADGAPLVCRASPRELHRTSVFFVGSQTDRNSGYWCNNAGVIRSPL